MNLCSKIAEKPQNVDEKRPTFCALVWTKGRKERRGVSQVIRESQSSGEETGISNPRAFKVIPVCRGVVDFLSSAAKPN